MVDHVADVSIQMNCSPPSPVLRRSWLCSMSSEPTADAHQDGNAADHVAADEVEIVFRHEAADVVRGCCRTAFK